MKKEEMIKALEALPPDAEICLPGSVPVDALIQQGDKYWLISKSWEDALKALARAEWAIA
jgi:hypothetical protein